MPRKGENIYKKTDLNGLTNMSKEKEKKVDTGLGGVSRILGIWTKYNAVVENNKKVDKNKETLAENNGQFCALNNLGLKYDTMVAELFIWQIIYDSRRRSY